MKNKKLDELVRRGCIKSYEYNIVDNEGRIGLESPNRNTEQLKIELLTCDIITIDTFCSGCAEDTTMFIN